VLYPSIDKLMAKVDSKYSLVVLAAKRARGLLEGQNAHIKAQSNKYVGVALEEISSNIVVTPVRARRNTEEK
jgi:DNA-directed RNA polymerase subunit omega